MQILDALAGTLRHKAQFMQADILEEAALEIRGRSEQAGGHILYGNLLREAHTAEEQGDLQTAKVKYREALTALEAQRQKRVVDRLHILAKIMLLTNSQQLVQRSSLMSDIEDSVRAIFCGAVIGTREGVERIGLIYDLCGKTEQAQSLNRLSEELREKVLPATTPTAGALPALPNNAIDGSRPQVARLHGVVDAGPAEPVLLERKSYDVQDVEEI